MLADELIELGALIYSFEQDQSGSDQRQLSLDHLKSATQNIKKGWRDALFSDSDNHSLRRYFNYHLEGISKISDTLINKSSSLSVPSTILIGEYQCALFLLIDHLFEFYGEYLNSQSAVPIVYQFRWYESIKAEKDDLLLKILQAGISAQLKECLSCYLKNLNVNGLDKHTFCSLGFFENVVHQLGGLFFNSEIDEKAINNLLFEMNFNHLGYYSYRQQAYHLKVAKYTAARKLEFYGQELRMHIERPEQIRLVYHHDWPSLKTMLCNFLKEEIQFIKEQDLLPENHAISEIEKIPLNLSVAHLACLIRLLFEEGCFGDLNLQDLFKFFAQHFRTKRQERVSSHSLSKEYYSINQITAAVMRDKLLKMVAWINQNFFPE